MPMNKRTLNKFMDISGRYYSSKEAIQMLKYRSLVYLPVIEKTLKKFEIPDDFKYLPLVESGLRNVTSAKRARGVWQLMPATAADMGMVVSSVEDERTQFIKSTITACRLIKQLYAGSTNWTITAAAYNAGMNNMRKAMKEQQQTAYYSLKLNTETSEYVYKIIILKLLLEGRMRNADVFGTETKEYAVFFNDTLCEKNLWDRLELNCYLQVFE